MCLRKTNYKTIERFVLFCLGCLLCPGFQVISNQSKGSYMIKADAKNSVAKQTHFLLIPKVEKLLFLMRF